MIRRPGRPGEPGSQADPFKAVFDGDLANQVKASAQQIWLAGMGAFARAQTEGGKIFDSLMKEGAALHRKTQAPADDRFTEDRSAGDSAAPPRSAGQPGPAPGRPGSDRFADLGDRMSGIAATASAWQAKAGQQFNDQFAKPFGDQWDKLESTFQQRLADALGRLGVPTARDVDALNARLDAIDAGLAALSKASPGRAAATGAARTAASATPTSIKAAARRRAGTAVPKRSALKRGTARKPPPR